MLQCTQNFCTIPVFTLYKTATHYVEKLSVTLPVKGLTLESVSLLNLNTWMAKSVASDVFSMEETLQ